jgi:hypothetical protein
MACAPDKKPAQERKFLNRLNLKAIKERRMNRQSYIGQSLDMKHGPAAIGAGINQT